MKKCNKRVKRKDTRWTDPFSKQEIEVLKANKLIKNAYNYRFNQKNPSMTSVIRRVSTQLIHLKATFINQLGYGGRDLLSALKVIADFHQKKKLRVLARKAVKSVKAVKNGSRVAYVSRA